MNIGRKVIYYWAFCMLTGLNMRAQHQIALPQITNYHSYDYKAGVQNWAIEQGRNGHLYFGNSEGLLDFDGKNWKRYQIPNRTVIRSLKIDGRGRIFVGGQSEMGYFFPNASGQLVYQSLNQLLPETERVYPDIWNLVIVREEVFFRSRHKLFHYKDGVIRIYKPETKWDFLGEANGEVYAQEADKGLLQFDNGIWKQVCQHPSLNESSITALLPIGQDSILVATFRKGIFLMHQNTLTPYRTQADALFQNDRIYCMALVNKDWIAIGTNGLGVHILDHKGRHIQTLSYQDGLQKNNVRSLGLDRNNNLWIGLENGIDMVAVNSAIKYIYPDPARQATGYAVRLFNNQLYIGTSNGLYASPIDLSGKDLSMATGSFSKVGNSSGQIWNLEEINDHLLVGHEDGGYVVSNGDVSRMYAAAGSWLFRPVSSVFPTSRVLVGTYTGLRLLGYNNHHFNDLGRLDGVMESLRFMSYDNDINTLWASHPNLGIYKIALSPGFNATINSQLLGSKHGLPADLGNYIFRIKNRIVVSTLNSVYEFDAAQNRFLPSPILYDIFKGMSIQYLHEDRVGNLWFITNKKLGVVDFNRPSDNKPYTIEYFPELNGLILAGYESIYSLNDENIFIAANKGIIHLNYRKYLRQISRPDVQIGHVRIPIAGGRDSVLFGGHHLRQDTVVPYQNNSIPTQLPGKFNSLHIEYASTLFDQLRTIEYNYKLEGFDQDWNGWSTKNEKDYTNLPPGKYTFLVKARNSRKNESTPVSYQFEVNRAWYNSYWMYTLYVLAVVSAIWYIFRWQQQKHQSEQRRLHYLHQLELDRNEKELIQLRNQKLESDLHFKDQELLTMTINLVQRGEVLTRLREAITNLIKKDVSGERTTSYRNLLRLIREVEKSNEDWNQFAIHFNNVNTDFFNTLRQAYPDLTTNDLKLSAYLRMNLSSKEIAQLLNITVKGVEVARYRLRKKLQISTDTNLAEFLTNLTKTDSPPLT